MILSDIIMLALLALASFTDLRARRIPNELIVAGVCLGLGIRGWLGGIDGALGGLLGGAVGLLVFLPFFALRWMGAGDVKLLCVVGTFVGLPAVVVIALYAAIAGAVISLATSFLVRVGWAVGGRFYKPGNGPGSGESRGGPGHPWTLLKLMSFQVPYAVAISIGTVIWLTTRVA